LAGVPNYSGTAKKLVGKTVLVVHVLQIVLIGFCAAGSLQKNGDFVTRAAV
jgi:hypothetical protein